MRIIEALEGFELAFLSYASLTGEIIAPTTLYNPVWWSASLANSDKNIHIIYLILSVTSKYIPSYIINTIVLFLKTFWNHLHSIYSIPFFNIFVSMQISSKVGLDQVSSVLPACVNFFYSKRFSHFYAIALSKPANHLV